MWAKSLSLANESDNLISQNLCTPGLSSLCVLWKILETGHTSFRNAKCLYPRESVNHTFSYQIRDRYGVSLSGDLSSYFITDAHTRHSSHNRLPRQDLRWNSWKSSLPQFIVELEGMSGQEIANSIFKWSELYVGNQLDWCNPMAFIM